MLEIYLNHKFQWLQEGLNFESLAYEVVTQPSRPWPLWSLEFVIQINLENDTITVWNLARSWSISTGINLLGLEPINGWVFVYELSGCGFESRCSHFNFRFRACFEQGVPWHSDNYRVWIRSEMRTWHDKNIQLKTYWDVNICKNDHAGGPLRILHWHLPTIWVCYSKIFYESFLLSAFFISNAFKTPTKDLFAYK